MEKIVQIPGGIEAKVHGKEMVVKGKNGEARRLFSNPNVKIELKEGSAVFSTDSKRKKDKAVVGTWAAHFRNMCSSASCMWEARLKVVYSHFPIKLSVEGKKVVIGNFLGERSNRSADIVGASKVEISKDEIIVTGPDKENVGHTAANIERASKVQGYDRRIFQDGCHLTQKARPVND
jgi:large subunit ribosomal protein L6